MKTIDFKQHMEVMAEKNRNISDEELGRWWFDAKIAHNNALKAIKEQELKKHIIE